MFNKLAVVSYEGPSNKYRFICQCGNERVHSFQRVASGEIKSCGKCGKGGRPLLENSLGAKRAVWQRYKQSAKRRGIEFSISTEDFYSLITLPCSYCKSPPKTSMKLNAHPDFLYTGLDRVNNSAGYTLNNVVPCCSVCNFSKAGMSLDEWKNWITAVYKALMEN